MWSSCFSILLTTESVFIMCWWIFRPSVFMIPCQVNWWLYDIDQSIQIILFNLLDEIQSKIVCKKKRWPKPVSFEVLWYNVLAEKVSTKIHRVFLIWLHAYEPLTYIENTCFACLGVFIPLENFSLIWRRSTPLPVKGCKFWSYGHWAVRFFGVPHAPTVTRGIRL